LCGPGRAAASSSADFGSHPGLSLFRGGSVEPPPLCGASVRAYAAPIPALRNEGGTLDSLAAVDWTAYETEALGALDAALSEHELDDARVKYLGRKSELAQALRGVRDRESGMLLNGIRAKLEEAVAAREAALVRLVYQQAAEAGIDVTIPGKPVRRGRLHLLTQ